MSLLTCFGLNMDENGIMILHQIDDCQFMGHIHINDIKLDDLQSVQQESCDICFYPEACCEATPVRQLGCGSWGTLCHLLR